MPATLRGPEWTFLTTVGPLVIGALLVVWVVWKN